MHEQNMTRQAFLDALKEYEDDEDSSLEEVKKKLQADAYIRTVGEVLARYCNAGEAGLQATIIKLLCESSGSGANRESIEHKVRGWLNNKNASINKDSAIQLAFAFGLKPANAKRMLWLLCGEGFHRRSPSDIIWLFALEHEYTYAEAVDLLARMKPFYDEAAKTPPESLDTENIKQRLSRLEKEEDLKNFLVNEAPKLKILFSPRKIRDSRHKSNNSADIKKVLMQYCNAEEKELSKKLNELLSKDIYGADEEIETKKISDKVNGWLNGKNSSIDRETAIKLLFALKLDLADAEEMLCKLFSGGFDLTDPEDIVLRFALEHNMSYAEACSLRSRMPVLSMTENIKQQIDQIQTEDELKIFLVTESAKLGELHNTAYSYFIYFMERLGKGGSMAVGENEEKKEDKNEENLEKKKERKSRKKTIFLDEREITDNILNNYFYRYIVAPKDKDNVFQDALQRSIKKNWPDKARLSHMKNRNIDVTRKVLILLFLACNGNEDDTDDENFLDESPEDIFDDTRLRLDNMLLKCGFPPLDSRNHFDWMVFYCLARAAYAKDIFEIDLSIRSFLSSIFDTSDDEAD